MEVKSVLSRQQQKQPDNNKSLQRQREGRISSSKMKTRSLGQWLRSLFERGGQQEEVTAEEADDGRGQDGGGGKAAGVVEVSHLARHSPISSLRSHAHGRQLIQHHFFLLSWHWRHRGAAKHQQYNGNIIFLKIGAMTLGILQRALFSQGRSFTSLGLNLSLGRRKERSRAS